jgi:hypothetical protein
MQLENININFPFNKPNAIAVPSREEIAQIVCPIYGITTFEEPMLLQHELGLKIENHPTLRDRITLADAFAILSVIRISEFNGVSLVELKVWFSCLKILRITLFRQVRMSVNKICFNCWTFLLNYALLSLVALM